MAKERIERDDEDLVRLYLTDIGQYPLLTKDDEVRLAQAIEAGRDSEGELAKAPKGLAAARRRELRRGVIGGEQRPPEAIRPARHHRGVHPLRPQSSGRFRRKAFYISGCPRTGRRGAGEHAA